MCKALNQNITTQTIFKKQSAATCKLPAETTLWILTAVTSEMAHSCSSLTFSTKNGVIPRLDT